MAKRISGAYENSSHAVSVGRALCETEANRSSGKNFLKEILSIHFYSLPFNLTERKGHKL